MGGLWWFKLGENRKRKNLELAYQQNHLRQLRFGFRFFNFAVRQKISERAEIGQFLAANSEKRSQFALFDNWYKKTYASKKDRINNQLAVFQWATKKKTHCIKILKLNKIRKKKQYLRERRAYDFFIADKKAEFVIGVTNLSQQLTKINEKKSLN